MAHNRFFNIQEFKNAHSTHESAPYVALKRLSDYLERYPLDSSARIYYADILVKVGRFDDALKELDKCNEDIENIRDKNKRTLQKKKMNFVKVKALMYLERYKEAYYLHAMLGTIPPMKTELFCCTHILNPTNLRIKEYISAIKKQYKRYLTDKEKSYSFASDFPLEEVKAEIERRYLTPEKCLFPGYYSNLYIFRYNSCGTVDGKSVNYFRVYCLHGTNHLHETDIIMFISPCDYGENIPETIDLNYMKQGTKNPLPKRKTRNPNMQNKGILNKGA